MKSWWIVPLVMALSLSAASAQLKVVGEGDHRTFDPASFPPDIREKYVVALVKCANNSANCHGFGRTVDTLMTGVGSISKLPFDKEAAKLYGVKMMRKPDSGMDKKETKAVVELLYYLIDQARRKK